MKQRSGGVQVEIEFQPELIEQFPEFRDVVRASVYSCGRPFKGVAADLDMSVSELSRKLSDNPNDPVHFPLHRLPELLRATGDLRPVHWLIACFMEDSDSKHRRAVSEISKLLPRLQQLMNDAEKK